jgi:hypothetical protein
MVLSAAGIRISMDGRGRVYDNIFVERLWRTVKYEEVYLHQYTTVSEARRSLERYFRFYNMERLHEALGYRTPYEVYFKEQPRQYAVGLYEYDRGDGGVTTATTRLLPQGTAGWLWITPTPIIPTEDGGAST